MKENIQSTRFENGLVVLTDKMADVRSATLGFFFRVGARNEPPELSGISHFIEHCVFKGTQKRSALDIAIETDRLGGGLEAFTTHEETGFCIKVIDDQVGNAFELLADMLCNPQFIAKELKSERRVIIEEIKMTEDSPEERLGDIFIEEFFAGHSLGRSIAGTPKTIRTFNSEITCKYHSDVFIPANLVITAAGNIEHKEIVKLAEKYFANVGVATKTKALNVKKPQPKAPIIIKQNRALEQAHLMLAVPFVAGHDDARYTADLLTNIIGGGTSSRLWQKIRENQGLAYSVGASSVMYRDCGFFSVFAATSPKQAGEVLDIAVAELANVVQNGVTEAELDLVKQQTKASVLLGLEDSAGRSVSLAQAEMQHGRQISVEETLANVDAVTIDDIKKLAKKHFRSEKLAFVALGNLKGLKVNRARLSL